MAFQLVDNQEAKQYEFHVDGVVARIEYIIAQNKIYLTHTEVPKELAGRGIGSALVLAVFNEVKSKELKIVPLCPFVAAYIKRHPEWSGLLGGGVNIE